MRWLAYKGTVLFLRSLLAPFVRVRTLHCERARVRGACILASNHISHFDPPLIAWCIPRKVDWMATLGLFSNRFIGALLRYIDTYPVDRSRPDRSTVRITLERLKLGRIVAIFPEGGIRDGTASVLGGAPPVRGPGALSQISGAPVLPCVILGTDRLYARRSYVPFRRVTVWIGFGELLRCTGPEKAERVALDQRLAEAMRALQREMSNHFDLTDDDLPRPPRERAASR